jgi:hypothetical protein
MQMLQPAAKPSKKNLLHLLLCLFFFFFYFFSSHYYFTDSASVVVHIINGEHPAAMQHGNSGVISISCHNRYTLINSFKLHHLGLSSTITLKLPFAWFSSLALISMSVLNVCR